MKINKRTVLMALLLIVALPVSAKSPLWKVSKGSNHLFIGGTVHVLSKDDYPLPAAFNKVYRQTEQLILETDMLKLQMPDMQMKMIQAISYQDGTTLKDHLKPETYQKLEEYLSKSGMPMMAVNNFKPGMVAMMLTVLELKRLGLMGEGVDQFYNTKARLEDRTVGKLETVDQQISFIATMGENNPDEFILYTLRDIKQLPKIFKEMKVAWRSGDTKKLAEIAIAPMKKEFPETYQTLLVKRNKAWVPQIQAMIKTKEIEMILVGALHLAGDESVLKQLEELGYKVEQL